MDSPNTVSSFHKVLHSYVGFHFCSIQDCAPYLNHIKDRSIFIALNTILNLGKISHQNEKAVFSILAVVFFEEQNDRRCSMFLAAFSANIYSTSLKVSCTVECQAPDDSSLLCSQQVLWLHENKSIKYKKI